MTKPNILLIVLDDLPKKTLETMPFTRAEIRNRGAVYPNGTITTPLCGTSRSTLLTGKVAHNHGVWGNTGEYGGWKVFSKWEANALPVALQNAGYTTGLFGKYMNGWNKTQVVPAGWDSFSAIIPDDGGDGAYYDYNLVGTEPTEHFGHTNYAHYSTDVISDRAAKFLSATEEPFFCYFSPYGAHASFTPAARHENTYVVGNLDPAVNSDNSLRAPWLRDLPKIDTARITEIYRKQHECVMSVDDGIEWLFKAIGPRLSNTLIVFTGDNGLQRGEQRLMGKNIGYPASTAVPMLARHDGVIPAGSKPDAITTNADITRTILDTAGTSIPAIDGLPMGSRTSGVLLEGMANSEDEAPSWIGWRTKKWLYLNYGTGQGEEIYNLVDDPNCLTNLRQTNLNEILEFRSKALAAANPLPPGFSL